MNKNKLIFSIIWAGLLLLIIFWISFLTWDKSPKIQDWPAVWYNIWTLNNDSTLFQTYLDDFKSKNPTYKNVNFQITNFENYKEYYHSLLWSFLSWKSPDMFVLNNNDWWYFDEQIISLDSTNFDINSFRNNFDLVFSNDLIKKTWEWENTFEILKGIPLWYETLWMYYNFLTLRWKKLENWSYVNDAISTLKDDSLKSIIWIWNWSTVKYSPDIFKQFLLLDWIDSIENIDSKSLSSTISSYYKFWDINWENWYNYNMDNMLLKNQNNLDLFSLNELQIVFWYPRTIEDISENWYNKALLRATNFPTYTWNSWKMYVDYNYFVVNKNTSFPELSWEILKYFSSEEWQRKYVEIFDYYLSPNLTVLNEILDKPIMDWFSVRYWDFYNRNLELSSFNVVNKTLFDEEMINILDKWLIWVDLFEKFKKSVLCISNKMITQQNFDKTCE